MVKPAILCLQCPLCVSGLTLTSSPALKGKVVKQSRQLIEDLADYFGGRSAPLRQQINVHSF